MAEENSLRRTSTSEEEKLTLTPTTVQPDHRAPTTTPSPTQRASRSASNFTFPTLRLDGSLPDLASTHTLTPSTHYPPAPPAALSSLGARTKMADHDRLSETSLDAGYDMIDDISEISTDDHDTASLLSTEREDDGQLTPEESIVDLQEERTGEDTITTAAHVTADNALLDSYMSEELETPRQSVMQGSHRLFPLPHAASSAAHPSPPTVDTARRVLFVSHHTVSNAEISDICLRIASCLLPEDEAVSESISRLVKLPLTPSGNKPVSAILLRIADVELLVEPRLATEPITFLHDDPDLVVYYLNQPNTYPDQFDIIKTALNTRSVPSVTVSAPGFDYGKLSDTDENRAYNTDIVLTDEGLFHADDTALRKDLQALLIKPPPQPAGLSSSVCMEYLWDRVCWDKCCKKMTWQELALRLLPLVGILLAIVLRSTDALNRLDGPVNITAATDVRRHALSSALVKMNYSADTTKVFNIDYLLPYPTETESSLIPNQVRFQGSPPNHILVSLPKSRTSHKYPKIVWANVKRSDTRLDFNQTLLIDGLYDFTIPADDAYGTVMVNIYTKKPEIEIFVEHNFGNRMLRRQTYEKAGMELSKTINKDVTVARKNVRSLSEKVGLELSAGATATKNVTSELAIYIARDLQVLANTALSVFGRAAAASNDTAATIKKELIVMQKELAVIQKDLIKLTKDVQKSVIKKANTAKALIPTWKDLKTPLVVSTERARKLRDALARRRLNKDTNSTSASKELSLRLQNFFNPSEKTKKAGSLVDIAKCARKDDYRACRRAQKAEKALVSVAKAVAASLETTTPEKAKEWKTVVPAAKKDVKAEAKTLKKDHGGCQSKKLAKKKAKVEAKLAKKEKQKKKAEKGNVLLR